MLRTAVARLYWEQSLGQRRTLEHSERDGCLYALHYLDDYTHTHAAHGTLTRTTLRPAFEVVYISAPPVGTSQTEEGLQ